MAFSVASSDDFELLDLEDSDQEELLSLSHWEFIDVSDADFKSQSDSDSEEQQLLPLVPDAPITPPPVTRPTQEADTRRRRETRLVRVLDLAFQTHLNHHLDQDHDDDVDEDVEDGYGLDDELVPWSVSDTLERSERMRKLGKRTFAKMLNSKRSPYLVVKPGCVRGKHGLGLKHIY